MKPRMTVEGGQSPSPNGTTPNWCQADLCRIDTEDELDYFRNGGILHYVLRNLAA